MNSLMSVVFWSRTSFGEDSNCQDPSVALLKVELLDEKETGCGSSPGRHAPHTRDLALVF